MLIMLEQSFLTLSFSFISVFIVFFFFLHSTANNSKKTLCQESYPIIGNLPGLIRNSHRFHDWVTDMISRTPSSTLQVNFLNLTYIVCTANPVNVEHILASNFSNYIKGWRYLDFLQEVLGHGIFNVDGQLWTVQRKIASHEFKTTSLKHFISDVVRSKMSKSLMPYLSKACDQNLTFDMQDLLQKFAFTNICNVAFGIDPESMSSLPFVKAFDDAVEIGFSRIMSPLPAIWKIKRFLNMGSEKRLKEAVRVINEFAMEIIKSRQEQEKNQESIFDGNNQDLLSRFMLLSSDMEFEDEQHKRKFLRDIVISFVLAGKDSTSTALTWFFWLIAGNPRCRSLIHNELSSAARPEEESRSRIFNYDELKNFHYLHAALSESMRLFPPVPINSRTTVEDDVLPDGTRVKKGWSADYSAYAMGRMETVWGEDCREFKPERWLDGDGNYQPFDQFRYPVFHCGPRMCLGKQMAYIQMKAIAAAVMYEFEVLPVDGGASLGKMKNPPYNLTMVLKMRGGLPVRLKRRRR